MRDGEENPLPPCVYFISSRQLGLVKIGRAKNALQRLSALRTGNPDTLTLMGVVFAEADDVKLMEKTLHQAFHYERVDREWFRPVPAMWEFLRECGMTPGEYMEAMAPEPEPEPRCADRPIAPTDRTYSKGAKGRMERYLAARGLDR